MLLSLSIQIPHEYHSASLASLNECACKDGQILFCVYVTMCISSVVIKLMAKKEIAKTKS